MAVATSTVLAGLSAVSAVSQIASGLGANSAAKQQSQNALFDAQNRGTEIARTTAMQANEEKKEADSALRRQKLAYLASGVTLQGSPLLVMEETRRKGQENVDEILKAGSSMGTAVLSEGRQSANAAKLSGRQALIGGITGAVGTGLNAYDRIK